jgi:hypothetical protein
MKELVDEFAFDKSFPRAVIRAVNAQSEPIAPGSIHTMHSIQSRQLPQIAFCLGTKPQAVRMARRARYRAHPRDQERL